MKTPLALSGMTSVWAYILLPHIHLIDRLQPISQQTEAHTHGHVMGLSGD